jgi:Protein of unknown function (DUF4079)
MQQHVRNGNLLRPCCFTNSSRLHDLRCLRLGSSLNQMTLKIERHLQPTDIPKRRLSLNSKCSAGYLGYRVRTKRLSPSYTRSSESAMSLIARMGSHEGWQEAGRAHYAIAAGALFCTTAVTFVGMANTFVRTGRLFPGPHLYFGLMFILALTLNGKQLWIFSFAACNGKLSSG